MREEDSQLKLNKSSPESSMMNSKFVNKEINLKKNKKQNKKLDWLNESNKTKAKISKNKN